MTHLGCRATQDRSSEREKTNGDRSSERENTNGDLLGTLTQNLMLFGLYGVLAVFLYYVEIYTPRCYGPRGLVIYYANLLRRVLNWTSITVSR